MAYFKSIVINCLLITLFCSSFINATLEEETKCKEEMEESFGLNTALLECIQKAIKEYSNDKNYPNYVKAFYLSFKDKVDEESVPPQSEYCIEMSKDEKYSNLSYVNKVNVVVDCMYILETTYKFGNLQNEILDSALYKHSLGASFSVHPEKIEDSETEQYFVHPPETYPFTYMEQIAKVIKLAKNVPDQTPEQWCIQECK